jgi:O-antigen/teichoic acid export membrane protein
MRTYVMVAAPVVAGLAAVGPELLPSLASEKYAAAAVVLPWVIGGMVVDGTNSMLGAGLFIHRRTRTIMTIVLSNAALNIALNFLLVPHFGILGSAIATLVSYTFTALALASAGRRLLPVAPPLATLVRAGVAAAVMYVAVVRLLPGGRLGAVAVRAVVGAPIYAVIMALIDGESRELLQKGVQKFLRRGKA